MHAPAQDLAEHACRIPGLESIGCGQANIFPGHGSYIVVEKSLLRREREIKNIAEILWPLGQDKKS